LYNDDRASDLTQKLGRFDALLVWVNPIEQGHDRKKLDAMLLSLSSKGVLVSAHPETILKMGTKDVLFKTRDMDWGCRINMYHNAGEFENDFPEVLSLSGVRVLKQYRGNGGNGVYKIIEKEKNRIEVVHAKKGEPKAEYKKQEFFNEFRGFLDGDGLLIDQPWNENMINGMVRCYLSVDRVAGFGYQEINALYELDGNAIEPSKRYYFTENCGLFRDLKNAMEQSWVPELMRKLSIEKKDLPLIWDADFFINMANNPTPKGKYTLCEINVSSVSPFPPSAVKYIADNLLQRLTEHK
jgi:hypothetical protein